MPSDAVFGEDQAPVSSLGSADAFIPDANTVVYEIVEGADAGKTVRIEQQAGAKADEWTINRIIEGAKSPVRVDHVRRKSDGSVLLVETESRDQNVVSRYEPPLVIVPASLGAGDAFEQKVELTVRPIDNPDHVDQRGPARNKVRLVASQSVRSPAGSFEAMRVESEFTADLSAANVVNKTTTWYAPDVGMIAERYDEVAKTLGIPVSQKRHFYVISRSQR